jgi:hypothetical protein
MRSSWEAANALKECNERLCLKEKSVAICGQPLHPRQVADESSVRMFETDETQAGW